MPVRDPSLYAALGADPHDRVVLCQECFYNVLLALEALWRGKALCRAVGGMCDRIDMELSHRACRALDRANRTGLVEKVREIGDVHG